MKYCEDCKNSHLDEGIPNIELRKEFMLCSLLGGGMVYKTQRVTKFCREMRGTSHLCGPDAKYFEAKEGGVG